jgi:dihydrofolate synthase/folylpolyglutamate synthase
MPYSEAIDALNAMTQELATVAGEPRRKFSLAEFRVLLQELGDPQKCFRSVLIAGTNGKGSTASTLASILQASGVRFGLYTSPHLERVNERIRVEGVEIADDDFAALFFRVKDAAGELVRQELLPRLPSFFEVLTAIGFLHFAAQGVEIAVLEVGMGGRLDATNVVDPLLSVITDISLDHTEWLGDTLSAIAKEKAGILRRQGILVILPQSPEVDATLHEEATRLQVRSVDAQAFLPQRSIRAGDSYTVDFLGAKVQLRSPLRGAHQQRNVALAVAAAQELAVGFGFALRAQGIEEGVAQTRWPGRLERVCDGEIEWIVDVAHNPAGARALRAAIEEMEESARPRTLIFGCLQDKPVAEIARILFPIFERVILTPVHSARAAMMDAMQRAASDAGVQAVAAASVHDAIGRLRMEKMRATVMISGSVYLVGEALPLLRRSQGAGQ